MEHIKKGIYRLPEMRRTLRPLWSAWVLVAIGALCAAAYLTAPHLSVGGSSALVGGIIVGGVSLVLVLCFWLFGDSRRPWHRQLRTTLEPTYTYYPAAAEAQLRTALEGRDEKALDAVKKSPKPELVLVRYSPKDESVYYSQLLRMADERRMEPLTDIIINNPKLQ